MRNNAQTGRRAFGAAFGVALSCLLLAACGGGGGTSSAAPANNSPAEGNAVIVSMEASPTTLAVGEAVTLRWSSSGAKGCEAGGAWSGAVALSGSRIVTPEAAGTFTYTVTCDGVVGSTSIIVGTAAAPAPTVSLSLAPASVPGGQPSTLTWSSANTTSCTASGAWNGNQATSGSIVVTQSLPGTYAYSLTCEGPGGSATGSAMLGVTSLANNMATVVIDSGPASIVGSVRIINLPFVSVTLCRPGTSICQTIDHVLVDTGSYGLRIIAPGILDPALALPALNSPRGVPVSECAQFVSGFLWGSVRRADVRIGGEVAPSLPIHQAGDTDAASQDIPAACDNTGTNLGVVTALGANGILGIGLFKQDCGMACAAQAIPGTYYECGASGCASIAMPLADQVANPVAAFSVNNNGVALVMPPVEAGGATTLTGTLVFGIDTQSNNRIQDATVYAVNSRGNFTTVYKGTPLTSSFLDSGSNGLFFLDPDIPACANGFNGFYCPAAPLTLTAVNTAADGGASATVNILLVNPQALDPTVRAASVGGPTTFGGFLSRAFDWGMPFFFGRTVFVAIEGARTEHGMGPYWAY